MGNRNPIAELVVAPSTVIIVPKLVTNMDTAQLVTRTNRVANKFCDFESFLPSAFIPQTSSIESLVGKTQKGVANITTRRREKMAV